MKIYNLLFLVIVLVTLQKSTAKEVAFPNSINGNGKILIDGKKKCTLKGCRYNDSGVVFCEVYFDHFYTERVCNHAIKNNAFDYKLNEPNTTCEDVRKVTHNHYRIYIDLSISGKCNLSNETKFKEIKLTYNYKGKDNYAQLIAEYSDYLRKGYLPDIIGTYKGLRYRFTFITTKNCTFKGEFSKIIAYKV